MPTRTARLVPALLVTLMGASTAIGQLPPRLVDPMPLLNAAAQPAPAAQRRVIAPPGPKPVGPYSPGIMAGDFLYVSGQGGRDRDGKLPDTIEGAGRQTLQNVKAIVEAAGLTMEHVVYTQVYLNDMATTTRWTVSGRNSFRRRRRPAPCSGFTGCRPTSRSRSTPSRSAISPAESPSSRQDIRRTCRGRPA